VRARGGAAHHAPLCARRAQLLTRLPCPPPTSSTPPLGFCGWKLDSSSEKKICLVCKLVLDKQAKMEQDGRAGGCSWGAELQQSAADHCHDPSERCPTAIGACQRHYIDSTVICIVTLLPAVALFPSWPSRGRTSQMPLNSVIWAVRDMIAYLLHRSRHNKQAFRSFSAPVSCITRAARMRPLAGPEFRPNGQLMKNS